MFPEYISVTIIVTFRARVGKDCSLLWNILTSNRQRLSDKYCETFITSFPSSSCLCFFDRSPCGFSLTLLVITQRHCLNSRWKGCRLAFGQPLTVAAVVWLLHTLLFWVGRVSDGPLLLCARREKNKCHLP